jgi:hypothetical protein
MPELPIACSLDAAGLQARQRDWQELIAAALRDRQETDTGVRLAFSLTPDVERRLSLLVAAERECCAFASWTVNRAGQELVLTVDSTGEGAAAVQELFTD